MTYPTIRPKVIFDFQNSRQLDPRITFSRSSAATYLNPDTGLITSAPNNVARFEKEGLLIEESRTNYTLQSTYVADSYEGTNTAATGSQLAPDGTSSAALWTEDSSTGLHTVREKTLWNSSSAGDDHTWSVFVKPNGRTKCRLYTGQTTTVTFDLTANTVSPSDDGTITPYADGWYRISTTSVNSSGDNLFHYIYFLNDSNSQSYAGDGSSGMYVWGWQVEGDEAFTTSYIPTEGSTATRAADVAKVTSTNFSNWYNENEGTLTIKATSVKEGEYVSALSSGTTGSPDTLALYRKDDDQWRIYNTAQVTFTSTDSDANSALAYSVSGTTRTSSAAWKGSLVSSVPTDTSSIPFTLLQIGTGPKGQATRASNVSRISYYDERLTDAALQQLTK
tara:strand:- start:1066 stop:2241 length:1176 start_codon:yes stop_codon:yes gene_type:complete